MTMPESIFRQRGFSLIEVMIAAAVFSMGLGGLSLLLMTAVHGTVEARNQTEAAMHASALAELILIDPATTSHYINPPLVTETTCSEPQLCPGANWAARNLASWQDQLQQSLAGATGIVCLDSSPNDGSAASPACDGMGRAVVKVFWSEPQHRDGPDDGLRRAVLRLPQ